MKKTRRFLAVFLFAVLLMVSSTECMAATQQVMISSISGNTMKYYKAVPGGQYFNRPDWNNSIGIGKVKTVKLNASTKFHLLKQFSVTDTKKVSKSTFIKWLRPCTKNVYRGKTIHYGSVCKLTIKNGVATKVAQTYQE